MNRVLSQLSFTKLNTFRIAFHIFHKCFGGIGALHSIHAHMFCTNWNAMTLPPYNGEKWNALWNEMVEYNSPNLPWYHLLVKGGCSIYVRN